MLFIALSKLLLSDSNSQELIVDFRKKEAKTHTPVYISGAEAKKVNSFRSLGITENLSWSSHITTITTVVNKALKSLYILWKLGRCWSTFTEEQ